MTHTYILPIKRMFFDVDAFYTIDIVNHLRNVKLFLVIHQLPASASYYYPPSESVVFSDTCVVYCKSNAEELQELTFIGVESCEYRVTYNRSLFCKAPHLITH